MRNRKIQGMRERLVELLIQAIEKGNNEEVILEEIKRQLEDLMVERRNRA